jgi:hypothetical protein
MADLVDWAYRWSRLEDLTCDADIEPELLRKYLRGEIASCHRPVERSGGGRQVGFKAGSSRRRSALSAAHRTDGQSPTLHSIVDRKRSV